MKFSSREDIAAPAEFVFDQLSDFTSFERAAIRRGARLRRLDTLAEPGAGMSWDVAFMMRSKPRQVIIDLRRFTRPESFEYAGTSGSFEMLLGLDLTPISPSRTRLQIGFEVKPRSLGGRLMIQSAKLGRSNLNKRFVDRVRAYALDIEDRARRAGVA